MSGYGVFANVVAVAGCLVASVGALKLAWMKRAKWQPPEEEVPEAVGHVSSLVAVVCVALLYVFGANVLGLVGLASLSVASLALTLVSLVLCVFIGRVFTFEVPGKPKNKRILGGFRLTLEAREIKTKHRFSVQRLLEDSQGDRDLVWSRASQAAVLIVSTLGYIGLIACGTITIAAAANLVSTAIIVSQAPT